MCRRRTNYARSRLQPFCQKVTLFDSDNPAGSCPRSVGSACPKASQSFAAGAAKESQIIFSGDMCGEENTARPANVRTVRLGRTARALQQAANPFVKKVLLFCQRQPRRRLPAGLSPRGRGLLHPRRALPPRAPLRLRHITLLPLTSPKLRQPLPAGSAGLPQLVQKPRRVSPPQRRKKVRSFSPATCAAEKILLRLQVWNLCAVGAQIMRAADCSPFVKK